MSVQRRRITIPRPLRVAIWIAVALGVFAAGYVVGRATQVPFSTDWWKTFAQPVATGTAGVLALTAGLAALFGAHLVSSRAHAATMTDIEHRDQATTVERLWKRFEWVVTQAIPADAATDPVIDAVQAAEMVVSIRDAAKDTDDEHLLSMLNTYLGDQIGSVAAEVGIAGDIEPPAPDNGAQTEEATQ